MKTFDNSSISRQAGTRYRIARLTSNIFNPFLLCVTLIIIIATISSSSFPEAVKWSLLSVGMGLLPVFLVLLYLLRKGKVDNFFVTAREQRYTIYLIGCLSSGAGCLIMFLLDAPSVLIAGFATGASTAVLFAVINLWWKISLHTAIASASSVMLVLLFGWAAAAALVIIPLTAWARIELKCHSFKQTFFGALLAAALVLLMFQPLADM